MNSIHNNNGKDQTLHDDLDQLGQSYAEMEQLEPPDLVDQAILNSAHRAVEKKPHWMRFGWLHGLTTTAVFVLAFSLILQQPESAPVYQQDAISNDAEPSQASKSISEPALLSPEVDDNAKLELKSDMARRQVPVMASAPVITAEKEESPEESPGESPGESRRESDPIITEIPSSNQHITLPAAAMQKASAEDFDRSKRREEIISADEAAYLTDTMQEQAADMPAESEAESAAGIVEAQIDPEPGIEEKIQRIIRLKIDGDETWIAELAEFKKQHPDFPIPEALSEQK